MLAWPVASVGWITSLVQRAAASQERINHFLFLNTDIKNLTTENTRIKGDIKFENVYMVYNDTNITALKNVNFTIKQGQTLGIFGKTGSGKSSLVNLICRLYDPTEGNITFGNTKINMLNLNNLRSSIAYVPQDGYLFSGNIRDNITFSEDEINEQRVFDVAKKAEILEEVNSFPNRFDTIIGERGVQLSGGQRQRIAIARAFYKNPNFFIFDDCLSAVDANKEQKILKTLQLESMGKGSIIISHRISSLKKADNIIVLQEGMIIEEGTHKELINLKGFYFRIYKSQTNNLNTVI